MNLSANDGAVGAEAAVPQRVTQQHDPLAPRLVFVERERPP
jgi:hypothetical protein